MSSVNYGFRERCQDPMISDFIPKLMGNIPTSSNELLSCVVKRDEMAPSMNSLLKRCSDSFYSHQYAVCVKLSEPLLDATWEKLNIGHWKDVNLSWRYLYSVVSLLKGTSQVILAFQSVDQVLQESMAVAAINTYDMGLLMGAPILENVLSKLSLFVHEWLAKNRTAFVSRECGEDNNTTTIEGQICLSESGSKQTGLHETCDRTKRRSETERAEFQSKKQKLIFNKITINTDIEIERVSCPSLELFRKEYLTQKKPVIITDAMHHWPAMDNRRWSVDYLRKVAGYRTVPIEIGSKYTDDKWTQKLMMISEFIDKFINKDESEQTTPVGYLAQHQLFNQIPELQDDIVIPDYCVLGGPKLPEDEDQGSHECSESSSKIFVDDNAGEDVDINAWFGPQATVSPLHHDPKENFLAQVVGRKYIRLYSEVMTPYLYPHDGFMDNTSQVDVENPDYDCFPLFKKAFYTECVLNEGEMLFIPRKCWHFVKSLSVSFSVSFWWQ